MNEKEIGSGSAPIRCQGCGSESFFAAPDGTLICDYCRTPYVSPDRECPICGTSYEPHERNCSACGVDLVRKCPNCGALNPLTTRRCLACGQKLEVLEAMLDRMARTPGDHLRRVREDATEVKDREERASRERLARMWAEEDRRRQGLAEAEAERKRQERILIRVTLVAAVVFIVVIVLLAIVLGGPAS